MFNIYNNITINKTTTNIIIRELPVCFVTWFIYYNKIMGPSKNRCTGAQSSLGGPAGSCPTEPINSAIELLNKSAGGVLLGEDVRRGRERTV